MKQLVRLEDWPSQLFALIEERRHVPFSFGSQDCCLFACDTVLAITGEDPAAPFRGYTGREEAEELVASFGDLEKLVATVCTEKGFAEWSTPNKARRGDLCLFDNAGQPAVGVCIGGEVAFPGARGLVFHPLQACRRAWRVG